MAVKPTGVWCAPIGPTAFGLRLLHSLADSLVILMHRGTHGWEAVGDGRVVLAHQVYFKDVSRLCESSHEVAVVGLAGGGWQTVWARSAEDVTYPTPGSIPGDEWPRRSREVIPASGAEVGAVPLADAVCRDG